LCVAFIVDDDDDDDEVVVRRIDWSQVRVGGSERSTLMMELKCDETGQDMRHFVM